MKTYLHFVFILFSVSVTVPLYGQIHSSCGTTIHEQATTHQFVQQQRSSTLLSQRNTLDEVPVKIHIIGSNTGAFAIDSVVIMEEFELVNAVFAEINIVFKLCESINYINDNNYVRFIKTEDEGLCDIHDVPDAINIYFASDIEKTNGEGICGYAYNFDIKPRVFMDNDCADNSSTLTHELGHAFSLLHTHSTSNGAELVSGTNCSFAGDLLCDTPADPKLSNDNTNDDCEYIGTALDNQQNAYMPSLENLMSYAPKSCRTSFTLEQLTQMEAYFIAEGTFLQCLDMSTSTPELTLSNNITVYPNPGNTSIFISELPEPAIVELLDTSGKILFTKEYTQAFSTLAFDEINQFNSGVYILKITLSEQIISKKLIRL